MTDTRPSALIKIAPIVFSLLVGCVVGYFARYYSVTNIPSASGAAPKGGGSPAGGMGAMGGSGGGMPGGGGGQASSATALTRMVRNLGTIEKVQNKGLTPDQMKKALPLLEQIQSADKLPEADCKAKLTELEGILTADQKTALADLTPARGGRGGGGAPGSGGMAAMGGMPGSGGRPGSGGMMGGGGMPGSGGGGGGQQDPERPFASDRNKQSLQDLISALKTPGKS